MILPSDSDYQTALQHPRQAFADPELREGVVELGTGAMASLPRPRAGNFATIYKVTCGEKVYAVRCFTRPFPYDLQSRYLEIQRHLEQHWLPYMVGFTFLPRGIHVRGRWVPIVKMEWVQGESLERYVGRHLHEPAKLFQLAAEWFDLVKALSRAAVAHGDLQHGNVIVTDSGLRLIDYDGMCVFSLRGRESHERGHANYQHPARDSGSLNLQLDLFPAWGVWLSLVALAHDPSLWERFQGGDDCLLFRRKDFVEPTRSPLLQALLTSPHARIREYVPRTLLSLLALAPSRLPELTLDEGLDKRLVPEPGPQPTRAQAHARALARFIAPASLAPREFSREDSLERGMTGGVLVTAILGLIPGVVFSPWWLVGSGLVGGLGLSRALLLYRKEPVAQEHLRLERQWAESRASRGDVEARLQQLRVDRPAVAQRAQAAHARLLGEQESLHVWMEEVRERNHDVDRSALDRVDGRRVQVDREELNARKDLEAEHKGWEEDAALQSRLPDEEKRQVRLRFKREAEELAARFDARREALELEEDSAAVQMRADGILSREFRKALTHAEQIIDQLREHHVELVEVDQEIARLRRECITLCWRELEAERAVSSGDSLSFTRFLARLFHETPEKS
ncbi:hypothetical protein HUA76_24915 [Myxococcus sp. CA056]|uniref:hypothetical protein n=1 Tax=Myxococcus sp. CA056 TaxID=2741740 RepID=UPI00157B14AE|nr:hypothetical protein [Myxococcus sp. CA056]NTX14051.1 hypothetical protein [Myxococcus sp. CA056]